MMLSHLIIIFFLIFIFYCLIDFLKLKRKKLVLKAKHSTTFNKKNLNNWMNLTKKERYDLSKQESSISHPLRLWQVHHALWL